MVPEHPEGVDTIHFLPPQSKTSFACATIRVPFRATEVG